MTSAREVQFDYTFKVVMDDGVNRVGYNPEGMLSFFNKLEKMNKQTPGKVARFFSSHPLTSERIQNVRDAMAKLPPKGFLSGDTAEFKRAQTRVP